MKLGVTSVAPHVSVPSSHVTVSEPHVSTPAHESVSEPSHSKVVPHATTHATTHAIVSQGSGNSSSGSGNGDQHADYGSIVLVSVVFALIVSSIFGAILYYLNK